MEEVRTLSFVLRILRLPRSMEQHLCYQRPGGQSPLGIQKRNETGVRIGPGCSLNSHCIIGQLESGSGHLQISTIISPARSFHQNAERVLDKTSLHECVQGGLPLNLKQTFDLPKCVSDQSPRFRSGTCEWTSRWVSLPNPWFMLAVYLADLHCDGELNRLEQYQPGVGKRGRISNGFNYCGWYKALHC